MITIHDRYFNVLGVAERQYVAYWKYTDYNTTVSPTSKRWAISLCKRNKDNDCTIVPIWGSRYFILTIFQNDFDRPWIDVVIEEARLTRLPHEIPNMARVAELV